MKKYKYQIIAVLIIALVVSSPLFLFYFRTEHVIVSQAGKEARNVASSIATFLEQDIDAYLRINHITDYSTEAFDRQYYEKMLSVFQFIKKKTKADYIFTEKLVSADRIAYILDAEPVDSESFSPIGTEEDSVSLEERQAFKTGVSTATGLVFDEVWGTYITGFAPIINPYNSEVIGVVGVDYSANYILSILQELNSALILLYAMITILSSVIAINVINYNLKRSNQDFLTGLCSRRGFEEALQDMKKLHKKTGTNFSMLVIDIDQFKQINDTYGHAVGDLVLKRLANLLSSNIKESDCVFRYGGDEFVVLLPDTNKDQASFIAKRLGDDLGNMTFQVNNEHEIHVTVSIGAAEYSPDISVDQLFHEADSAMYQKKSHHKKMLCL